MAETTICSTTSGRFFCDLTSDVYRGRYGKVYKGVDKETNQYVALKIMTQNHKPDCASEDLCKIDCANVAKFVGTDLYVKIKNRKHPRTIMKAPPPVQVIAMEFCNGVTLEKLIKENAIYNRGLPDHMLLLLAECLYKSLEALQKEGLVRRAITVYNVMSHTQANGQLIFKVVDFGFSKISHHDSNEIPDYHPMELFHDWIFNKSDVFNDYDLDLFMAGVTLFYAATGKLPFQMNESEDNSQTCHEIWGEMFRRKSNNVLSIEQDSENGPLKFYESLQETCNLTPALRGLMTPIVKQLLSRDDDVQHQFQTYFTSMKKLLQMQCLRLYQLHVNRMETVYLQEMKWESILSAASVAFSGDGEDIIHNPDCMFVHRGHILSPGTHANVHTILPSYPALQRDLDNLQPPPCITITLFNDACQNLLVSTSQQNSFVWADGTDAETTGSGRMIDSLDEMLVCGKRLQEMYEQVCMEDKLSLMDEVILAWSDMCLQETLQVLTLCEHFNYRISVVVKMCTSSVTFDWNQLMQAGSVVMGYHKKYKEILLGPKFVIHKWRPTCKFQRSRRASMLALLKTYNSTARKYLRHEPHLNTAQGAVDKHTVMECLTTATELLRSLESELQLKRQQLAKVMKKMSEVMTKMGSLRSFMEGKQKLEEEMILNHIKHRKSGEGDVVRCLSGLLELTRKSVMLKSEFDNLESTLNTLKLDEGSGDV